MFGLGSKLRRIGTKPIKVQMSIDLKSFNNDPDTYRADIAYVFVEFIRGSNSVVSSRKEWPDSVDKVVLFDEVLTLVMTLYQNKDMICVEKKGKLVLKGVSKLTSSTEILGTAELKLHTLAQEYTTQRVQFELLDKCKKSIGKLNTSTTAKYLGEGKDDDDSSVASSVQSEYMTGHGPPGLFLHARGAATPSGVTNQERYANPELIAKFNHHDPIATNDTITNTKDALETDDIGSAVSKQGTVPKKGGISGTLTTMMGTKEKEVGKHLVNNESEESSALSSLRAKKAGLGGTHAVTRPAQAATTAVTSANANLSNNTNFSQSYRTAPRTSNHSFSSSDDKDREIAELRQQLEETNLRQNKLEGEFQQKLTAMIERIIEMEDNLEVELFSHEEVVIKLLKAAGVYERAGYIPNDASTTEKLHDEHFLEEIFRQHNDEERTKILTLKELLMKFSGQLSREDNQKLLKAGLILVENDG